jgi:cytochrome c oxidase subunit II
VPHACPAPPDPSGSAVVSPAATVDNRHEWWRLAHIYLPIAIGVFAVITVTMLLAVLLNRRRSPPEAMRFRENNTLEGTYALLLACVVAFLLYLTFGTEHQVDTVANTQRPAVTINALAAKWEWQFTYPSYGFSVHSGTVGRQPLVVPVGEPVRFTLASQDVIHAFWVPEVRYKHDLIPGRTQYTTLTFEQTGVFPGQCAEFCGLRHADMLFNVVVVSPSRFAAWARSGGRSPIS